MSDLHSSHLPLKEEQTAGTTINRWPDMPPVEFPRFIWQSVTSFTGAIIDRLIEKPRYRAFWLFGTACVFVALLLQGIAIDDYNDWTPGSYTGRHYARAIFEQHVYPFYFSIASNRLDEIPLGLVSASALAALLFFPFAIYLWAMGRLNHLTYRFDIYLSICGYAAIPVALIHLLVNIQLFLLASPIHGLMSGISYALTSILLILLVLPFLIVWHTLIAVIAVRRLFNEGMLFAIAVLVVYFIIEYYSCNSLFFLMFRSALPPAG